MSKDTGGNAFPTHEFVDGVGDSFDSGMTLRDYAAIKAMQGLCAGSDGGCNPDPRYGDIDWYAATSRHAYAMADAMLEARK